MIYETAFLLDATAERVFEGHSTGDLWNGWAAPVFTFEQAQKIVAAWHEQHWEALYDKEQDAFVFSVNQEFDTGKSEEFETFPAMEIEGRKLYGIGAYVWTWEEAENSGVGA